MANQTVTLHRIIKASPEKVFRAFADPVAYATWIPPYGFLGIVQHMDFQVGGTYHMTFINFSTTNGHSFGGSYLDIKTDELIQYGNKFDDPNMPGEMITTVKLSAVISGTELSVVQEGIPEAIPAEMCYLGWQESLEKLVKLVEPEIPDA